MSDIKGEGHGSSHDWKRGATSFLKVAEYSCTNCGAFFRHCYDDVPDIFEAMKAQDIKNDCLGWVLPDEN